MSDNTNRDILIAGAFAAFTVDLLVYPLDTVKTRIQSPDYRKLYTHGANNAVNRTALFRGLYQGVGSVIIATLPSSGAFFTTYEGIKSQLHAHNPGNFLPDAVIHSSASSAAELVSCAILTPAEVIKQNAQMVSASSKANATLQTLSRFRSNPLALWRGYTALAGRNLPFTALQFPLFERLKAAIKAHRAASRPQRGEGGSDAKRAPSEPAGLLETGVVTGVAAGLAGSVAAVVTTPVDVVKTRIMLAAAEGAAQSASSSSSSSPPSPSKSSATSSTKAGGAKATLDAMGNQVRAAVDNVARPPSRKSSLQIAREIVAERGVWRGLFRGGALRAVWTMLGSGLYLGVYDAGRLYLAGGRGLDDEE